jgi:hypothetical protein
VAGPPHSGGRIRWSYNLRKSASSLRAAALYRAALRSVPLQLAHRFSCCGRSLLVHCSRQLLLLIPIALTPYIESAWFFSSVVLPAALAPDVYRDPADVPVLGTAIAGECALLISVDRDLLDMQEFQGDYSPRRPLATRGSHRMMPSTRSKLLRPRFKPKTPPPDGRLVILPPDLDDSSSRNGK